VKRTILILYQDLKLFLHPEVEGFKRFSGIEVDDQLIEQKFLEKFLL